MAPNSNYSTFALVSTFGGIVIAKLYTVMAAAKREPYECTKGLCMDLRGLNDLLPALGIIAVFALIGVGLSFVALRKQQRFAKISLLLSAVVLLGTAGIVFLG